MEGLTKELLDEVLIRDRDITSFEAYNNNAVIIKWTSGIDSTEVFHIENIYELAHKFKEWAYMQGYQILIYTKTFYESDKSLPNGYKPTPNKWIYEARVEEPFTNNFIKAFKGCKTEPEAVFKACQWIMEQQEK